MKKAVIVLFVLSTIITFYSCGSKTTNEHEYVLDSESVEEEVVEDLPKFPLIDFEGVGEIKIGSYVSNIPSKSSFYDKIIINKIYSATLGDHGVYLSENELEKYKDDPYVDVDGELLEGIVKNGNDTMIIFRSSNSSMIDKIEIYSPNLKFENGIGVGLRTDELCSNYNASILSTDLWAGTYAMWYDIPNFPSNVGLYLAKNKLDEMNIFEYVDGTGIMIPKGGELIREEEDGHSQIYRVSKSLVENSYIEYIIIREKSKVNTVRSESSFADKDSEIDDDTYISKILETNSSANNSRINSHENDYSWLEGRWIIRYFIFGKEYIEELRIGDIFGDGTLMMTIWCNGVKETVCEIEIRDDTIYCNDTYYPIDVQKHTIYADRRREMAYTYAGKLW